MNILVIEDELLLARQLMGMVAACEPGTTIQGPLNSVQASVNWLNNHNAPDLILMDIELADGQCFEIFNQVPLKSPVVFTTAYNEYALRAFKVNSIDYLMKPVQEEELLAALNKWKEVRNFTPSQPVADVIALVSAFRETNVSAGFRERFLVKKGQKMVSVNTSDIAYFYSKKTLTYIVTKARQKFVIDYTLDELDHALSPKQFFRANRQFILSHAIIMAIHPWFNGKMKLDTSIPVEEEIIISREKAPLLREWMGA